MKNLVKIGAELHEIEKLIDSYEMASADSWLTAGVFWKTIKDTELWRGGGSHLNNFRDYIRDRGRKVSTVYRQIMIVERLEGFSLVGCIPERLIPIARARKRLGLDNETTQKLLDFSRKQGATEETIINSIREISGRMATDECEHGNIVAFSRCRECGKWLRG